MYYSILSSLFLLGGAVFNEEDGYISDIDLDDSAIGEDELDTGGLFGSGISFGRFAGMIGFGIGLPDDTPFGFSLIFGLWQSIVTIFTLGFVISSIWNG